MTAVQGVLVATLAPMHAAQASNPDPAGRATASQAPRIAFRTLLLDREAVAADPGRQPPAAPSSGYPSALLPASRPAHGAAGQGRGQTAGEDDPGEVPVGSANQRRAGEKELETALSVPPPVIAPPPLTPVTVDPQAASSARAVASLEDLLPALVRRIAWSGDGQRGSVRLELGAGELAGATLLVHADAGRVSVQMDVPPGVDAAAWEQRLRARLAARGLPTDTVEVT